MASRLVQCIAKLKQTLSAVDAIPLDSRTVSEAVSIDAGTPGIFLEIGSTANFTGHAMAGMGPAQAIASIPFAIVFNPNDLDEHEPATQLVGIAESIRLAFEDAQRAGEFRGLGALFVEGWACDVHDEWPVISGSIQIQGFF